MNLIRFNDCKTEKDPIFEYQLSTKTAKTAIVIDNGSFRCRAGWATDTSPKLDFRNHLGRTRKDRHKKDVESQMLVGNDIANLESMRLQLRNQFDRNVVIQYEYQQFIFDYIFTHLGLNCDQPIEHPVILTETYLNLASCRKNMSELLFEKYNVPGVIYGVDALFVAYDQLAENKSKSKSMILLNLGHTALHIIPILKGEIVHAKSRRINIGGFDILVFLHKLLLLKYPLHANAITMSRCEELLYEHCEIAIDYNEEIAKWFSFDYYEKNVLKIQLPYNATVSSSTLTVEQQKEKKRVLGKRLREMNLQKREEKLAEDERQFRHLCYVHELFESGEEIQFDDELEQIGLDSYDDLIREMKTLSSKINKTKEKMTNSGSMNGDTAASSVRDNKSVKLSTTKSIFAIESYESPALLVEDARRKKADVLKKKHSRKQRKHDLTRRGTAASQERMRLISQLARKEKDSDDFGMRDEDWDVYKIINKNAGDSDSEYENEVLSQCEEVLKQYDPLHGTEEKRTQAEHYQLHFGIERYRALELIFNPSMNGTDECGLIFALENVFKQFSADDQLLMANDILVTGGCARFRGIQARVVQEIRKIRPFQSHFDVRLDPDPSHSAWRAAQKWASDQQNIQCSVTSRDDFLQNGSDILKRSFISNPYASKLL